MPAWIVQKHEGLMFQSLEGLASRASAAGGLQP
jgi:hypothetical protein